MKFVLYEGNPRVESAKKITEVNNLSDALNRLAIERNHGKEAYILEVPTKGDE